MDDVVIAGAGPAGATAAILLARAGARVRIFDRALFPRDKLCGDTVNPGTLAELDRLGVGDVVRQQGLRVDGMAVSGEHGVRIEGRYPRGLCGRALLRRDLDSTLLQRAMDSGAVFEPGVAVRSAIVANGDAPRSVAGVVVDAGGQRSIEAPVTIAADGRHSAIGFGLGLAQHPRAPRRWAIGAYFEGVADTTAFGEMHVRRGRYFGIASVPGGLINVCLVVPSGGADERLRNPSALLTGMLAADPLLADRFTGARMATAPVVLGPLAVDASSLALDGLIMAGDAAGFIDPMTGDGLRFAIRGGALAAQAALQALEHGWRGVHHGLASARRREFAGKQRFNRLLRSLVASPLAIDAAAVGARLAPAVLRAVIARAGDCDLA